MECDIRHLPFQDEYASEVHAIHVVEHFSRLEADAVLKEWCRVLKPGGKIALECPSLDKISQALQSPERSQRWLRMTLIGLYGEYWNGDAMLHKWCYSSQELSGMLERAGFGKVMLLEPLYHLPDRDLRMVARKQ